MYWKRAHVVCRLSTAGVGPVEASVAAKLRSYPETSSQIVLAISWIRLELWDSPTLSRCRAASSFNRLDWIADITCCATQKVERED